MPAGRQRIYITLTTQNIDKIQYTMENRQPITIIKTDKTRQAGMGCARRFRFVLGFDLNGEQSSQLKSFEKYIFLEKDCDINLNIQTDNDNTYLIYKKTKELGISKRLWYTTATNCHLFHESLKV